MRKEDKLKLPPKVGVKLRPGFYYKRVPDGYAVYCFRSFGAAALHDLICVLPKDSKAEDIQREAEQVYLRMSTPEGWRGWRSISIKGYHYCIEVAGGGKWYAWVECGDPEEGIRVLLEFFGRVRKELGGRFTVEGIQTRKVGSGDMGRQIALLRGEKPLAGAIVWEEMGLAAALEAEQTKE